MKPFEQDEQVAAWLLDGLFEQSRVGLGLLDEELRYVRVNPALAAMNGLPAEAHVGRHVDAVVPELGPVLTPQLARVVATGEPVIDLPVEGRTPGSRRHRHWLGSYHRVQHGDRGLGVGAVVLEVTDNVEIQRALAAREKQQAVIAKLGLLALASTQPTAALGRAASSVAEFLGVEFALVLDRTPTDEMTIRASIGFGELEAGTTVELDRAPQAAYTLEAGRPVVVERMNEEGRFAPSALLRRHGVVSSLSVLIPGPETPFGVLGLYTHNHRRFSTDDVNFAQAAANVLGAALVRERAEDERRRLEAEAAQTEALRRSDELKTAVLRTVSHDLRSPLAAILTAAQTGVEAAHDEETRDLATIVVDQATQLAEMIDKLLDLSRLTAHAASPQPEWSLLDDIVDAAVHQVPGADQLVMVDLAQVPPVRVDPAQLQAAFANLIENACRVSRDGGVEVTGHAADGTVVVEVRDSGPGVAPEDRERIFEPFVRARAISDGRHPGLGLAIVRGFVNANGGRVWVKPSRGRGAVFAVELPVEPPAAAERPEGAVPSDRRLDEPAASSEPRAR